MLKSLFTHVKYAKKQSIFIFIFQLMGVVLLTGERLTKMMTENLGYNYTYPVDAPSRKALDAYCIIIIHPVIHVSKLSMTS